MTPKPSFSKKLTKILELRGEGKLTFAKRSGIGHRTIFRLLEENDPQLPRIATQKKIVEALGLTLDEFNSLDMAAIEKMPILPCEKITLHLSEPLPSKIFQKRGLDAKIASPAEKHRALRLYIQELVKRDLTPEPAGAPAAPWNQATATRGSGKTILSDLTAEWRKTEAESVAAALGETNQARLLAKILDAIPAMAAEAKAKGIPLDELKAVRISAAE